MAAARRIRLDCLGSGFAFSSGRYWNGWLLNGRVLLDCPPQALPHLYRLGRSPADIDLVLLSHEHGDHIGGVDLFLLDAVHRHGERDRPWAIAGPTGIFERVRTVVGDHSHRVLRDDPRFAWIEDDGGARFEWAGVVVETVRMQHAVPDNGYRIHIDGAVVAYTGDTAPGPHIAELAEGADVLIVECGGGGPGLHCDWDDVIAIRHALPASTKVLVTHYDPLSVPPLPPLAGFTLAEDFAVYEY
ncbi:MAG: ribonuclease Z [Chloroflexi bacterium]|nr:ribonuclease Z [Chloroflexota bacterium]